MPGMDGRETLVRIRQTETFCKIPVVLFTTSSSDGDKSFASQWGAHFITKPQVYSELEILANRFLNLCESNVTVSL
jgi:CheY-like chemotaxis protein